MCDGKRALEAEEGSRREGCTGFHGRDHTVPTSVSSGLTLCRGSARGTACAFLSGIVAPPGWASSSSGAQRVREIAGAGRERLARIRVSAGEEHVAVIRSRAKPHFLARPGRRPGSRLVLRSGSRVLRPAHLRARCCSCASGQSLAWPCASRRPAILPRGAGTVCAPRSRQRSRTCNGGAFAAAARWTHPIPRLQIATCDPSQCPDIFPETIAHRTIHRARIGVALRRKNRCRLTAPARGPGISRAAQRP